MMTTSEFEKQFGLKPEKAKELMELLVRIVNREVKNTIEHADFYMNPMDYCEEEHLKEWNGEDCFDKDDDSDGYPNLYDFKRQNSAEKVFMEFISLHTRYGGHTSAIEACELMEMEGWK